MSIVPVSRRIGESVIFPSLNRFFYPSSFDNEKADIGVVSPGSRDYRLMRYEQDYQLFPEYPEIKVRANPNRRSNLVVFALEKPNDLYVARAERILKDFRSDAEIDENGILLFRGRRYRITVEDGRYKAGLM
jgi:hypothetical protein